MVLDNTNIDCWSTLEISAIVFSKQTGRARWTCSWQKRLPRQYREAPLWLLGQPPRPERGSLSHHSYSQYHVSTYPLDHGETHFSDLDHRSDQPDVGDGGKSEDDGPEDGEGEDEDSGEDPVEPELGLTEQDERQAPQRIEPVGRVWLSQDVSKVEL